MSAKKSHDKSANKRRENDDRNARDSSTKEVLRCKFCGGKHRAAKKSCPAFGRRCSACGRMNHFATQCLSKTRVTVVESENEESQVVRVHVASDLEYVKNCLLQLTSKTHQLSFNWIVAQHAIWFPQSFLDLKPNCFPRGNYSQCITTQSWNLLERALWQYLTPRIPKRIRSNLMSWTMTCQHRFQEIQRCSRWIWSATPKCYDRQHWGSAVVRAPFRWKKS